jgi:hypothetical protein
MLHCAGETLVGGAIQLASAKRSDQLPEPLRTSGALFRLGLGGLPTNDRIGDAALTQDGFTLQLCARHGTNIAADAIRGAA